VSKSWGNVKVRLWSSQSHTFRHPDTSGNVTSQFKTYWVAEKNVTLN